MNRQSLLEPLNLTDERPCTGSGSGDGGKTKVHHNAKLTPLIVWEIRQRYKLNTDNGRARRGQMQGWLARHFNLPVATIQSIVRWRTWRRPSVGMTWKDWEKENGLSA